MIRVLLPFPDPAPSTLEVTEVRFHYLAHVLRLEEGDTLQVFDGRGRAGWARVTVKTAHALTLALEKVVPEPRGTQLTLVQGLPKGDKLEWVLQKATELGCDAFRPAAASRSVVKLSTERTPERLKRWERILEEAARQCGRSDVPALYAPEPLVEAAAHALGAPSPTRRLLVLDEEERSVPLRQGLWSHPTSGEDGLTREPMAVLERVVVVVGPEGGLSRDEVDALRALGGLPVSLGRRVLRTETAALTAVALVRHLLGDLG